MKPQDANPQNFQVDKIIFNNQDFSISYGQWQDGNKSLAMRWNGDIHDPQDKGYPKTFGNPMWFLVDSDLTIPILKSLIGHAHSSKDELLKLLEELI